MRSVHDMVTTLDLLYRALYRGVLTRMPERRAVAMGQWGLRHLPLDRLDVFKNADPRLAVTLGDRTSGTRCHNFCEPKSSAGLSRTIPSSCR